jgi:CRISPR-associated protein Csd2
MEPRELFVFKHNSALGEAPSHRLFDLVTTKVKDGVVSPRKYFDYETPSLDQTKLPAGVTLLTPFAIPAAA